MTLPPLPPRDGYRLWAPRYEAETAVSFLEDRVVHDLRVGVTHRRLLDVGCGTGRRLRRARAAFAVGVDVTPEMLGVAGDDTLLAAGDACALPVASASFDVVWCRLVLGHVADPAVAYAELVRVCAPGGMIIVTDFHADAVAAGHRRTFRDADGVVQEVEHHVHDHLVLAAQSRLTMFTRREGAVGPLVRSFYANAGRLPAYKAQRGLKLVSAYGFLRGA